MSEPKTYLSHPKLTEFIASYGVWEIHENVEEPFFSPPLGYSGFIINIINSLNVVITQIEDRDFFSSNYVATGQVTKPIHGKLVGHTKSLMVFFNPLGMFQLFGNDMSILTNQSMDLNDFLGEKQAQELIKKLKSNLDDDQQIMVLNNFFLSLNPFQKDITKLKKALQFIHQKNGDVSIHEILNHSNCHRKTLERQFKRMIGLSPKVYSQIYQFKCLFNLLRANPQITWTQLAEKAGYFDQSHMSRYVKEYLNVSPNSIIKLNLEFITYLLNR